MSQYIKWIDFKALERVSIDKNFGLIDFLFFGSRKILKYWWYLIIPFLNAIYAFIWFFYFVTFPIRWYMHYSQTKELRNNAYDIEDTACNFRLIRNRRGYIGLCEWGDSYEFSRKVILESKYLEIERLHVDRYVVTDRNHKKGMYSPLSHKWIIPCECKDIEIESNRIIRVTINGRNYRYNINGDRVLN